MTNNKQSIIDWLQEIELQRDLNLSDYRKAKEMEKQQKQISYAEGYAEGYKRGLEIIKWNIENQLQKNK